MYKGAPPMSPPATQTFAAYPGFFSEYFCSTPRIPRSFSSPLSSSPRNPCRANREQKEPSPIPMGYLHGGDSAPSPPSLKQRIRSASCFSCCFRGCGGPIDSADRPHPAPLIQCPSTWLRSKALEIPDLKERCRGLISRGGRPRRHAGDFGYDPITYALNFDDGPDVDDDGEISPEAFRYRSFSSRLPPTPPHPAAVKQIACS